MKRFPAIAIVTALSLSVIGCTASDDDPVASEIELVDTTPAASGDIDVVNWGVPASEPISLDWIYAWDYGPANLIVANLCEGLLRQNPDGSTSPALATAVETPDDTTLVYTIREGVTFTDGSPLTVDDVVYSLTRNLTASPPSWWGLWYANVASIEATGDFEVTVKLTTPDALFASVMTTPAGYVGKKAYIEGAGAEYGTAAGGVMCTGPYGLESWDKGQRVTLSANESYWDESLQPKASTFTFSFVPDPAALNSALLTGELDGAWSVDLSALKALENAGSGELYFNEGTEVIGLQFNDLTQGPLADQRIREALRQIIDYDGITQGLLGGYAGTVKSPAPAPTWGYSREIWQAADDEFVGGEQNLEAAGELIAEAGVPTEPIVIAVTSDEPAIVNAVTTIQASAATVGLDIEIRKMTASEYSDMFFDAEARAGVHAALSRVTVDTPDPLEIYYQLIPGSPYNYTEMSDPEWTDSLLEAVGSFDDNARAMATIRSAQLINDKVYAIPMYSPYTRVFLGERVTGLAVSSLSQWYYPWAATVGAR
jgi:peptide/nickel transport system substrate-binding protein